MRSNKKETARAAAELLQYWQEKGAIFDKARLEAAVIHWGGRETVLEVSSWGALTMTENSEVEVDFYIKRYSDFDLLRIARAVGLGYEEEVASILVNVHISRHSAVGVVFGHTKKGPNGRYADGHFIQISDILATAKEGRFWVVTTINSRYVIATFQRDGGRSSFNEFWRLVGNRYPNI